MKNRNQSIGNCHIHQNPRCNGFDLFKHIMLQIDIYHEQEICLNYERVSLLGGGDTLSSVSAQAIGVKLGH